MCLWRGCCFSGSSAHLPRLRRACSHDVAPLVVRRCLRSPAPIVGSSRKLRIGHSSSSGHYSHGVSGLCDKLPPVTSRGLFLSLYFDNGDAHAFITRCEACDVDLTRRSGLVTVYPALEERQCDRRSSPRHTELRWLKRADRHGFHEHGRTFDDRRSP